MVTKIQTQSRCRRTPFVTRNRHPYSSPVIVTLFLAVSLGATLLCAPALGQSYPAKPIRLILPFAPGSPSDMVGRTIGQKMGAQMGQNLVPDNRAGAGGTLGLAAVAKSPPDGYTVLVTSPTIAISPVLYANLPFDSLKDFAPVGTP